jgi:hypothetical protein
MRLLSRGAQIEPLTELALSPERTYASSASSCIRSGSRQVTGSPAGNPCFTGAIATQNRVRRTTAGARLPSKNKKVCWEQGFWVTICAILLRLPRTFSYSFSCSSVKKATLSLSRRVAGEKRSNAFTTSNEEIFGEK